MSNKKQSSVDWLFQQIPIEFTASRAGFEALQMAKTLHESEIRQAYHDGNDICDALIWMEDPKIKTSEQYYNETYEK